MVGELLTGLAGLLAVVGSALAWGHARRVGRVCSAELASITAALRREPSEHRIGRLRALAPPGSWEASLAEGLADAGDERQQIAAANDALAEASLGLEASASWPGAALRILSSGGLLLAVVAFIATRELAWSGAVALACAPGIVATLAATRHCRRVARRQRERIDGLLDALFGREVRAPRDGATSRRRPRG